MGDYNILQNAILNYANQNKKQVNPENLFMLGGHMDYVTGRNAQSYLRHLFPDYSSEKELVGELRRDKVLVLDLGSGLNHLMNSSLITKLNKGEPGSVAVGLDIVKLPDHPSFVEASLFKTKLKASSFDIVLSHYVLYSHIETIKLLKKAFVEVLRILRKGGELRVYPVYFGNYFLGDEGFKTWIQDRFEVEVLSPRYYVDRSKKKCLMPCTGEYETFGDSQLMERMRHNQLDVKTVVFIKK